MKVTARGESDMLAGETRGTVGQAVLEMRVDAYRKKTDNKAKAQWNSIEGQLKRSLLRETIYFRLAAWPGRR